MCVWAHVCVCVCGQCSRREGKEKGEREIDERERLLPPYLISETSHLSPVRPSNMAEEKKDPIAEMYEAFAHLKSNPQMENYLFIVDAVGGGDPKVKALAAQFIPMFFHLFSDLHDKALNALYDLIEDDDLIIRIQAIRGLSELCKNSTKNIPNLVNCLCQLLSVEHKQELKVVHQTLGGFFDIDAKEAYSALLEQINNAEVRHATKHTT
jgi:hypothetical protein